MDNHTREKIGRAVKRANWKKRLSVGMKASWARRRAAAAEAQLAPSTSLVDLQQAALLLGANEDELRAEIISHVSTPQLVGALSDFRGAGTNLQKKLRDTLRVIINRSLEGNHTA